MKFLKSYRLFESITPPTIDDYGKLIMDSIDKGDFKTVKELIDRYPELIEYRGGGGPNLGVQGYSPFMYSTYKLLVCRKNNDGIDYEYFSIFEYLIKRSDLTSKSSTFPFSDGEYLHTWLIEFLKDSKKHHIDYKSFLFNIEKKLIEIYPPIYNMIKNTKYLHPDIDKEFPDLIDALDLGIL